MTSRKSECPAATGHSADETNQHADSLLAAQESGNYKCKDFATLRAEFAQRGRKLTRCHRLRDGHVTYTLQLHGEPRHFNHLHDAETYLQQIGRCP